jgi:ribonuclease P protein component
MREAHLPTQQSQAEEEARLPPPHAHARRTSGPPRPPSARPQAPQRLTWRIRDRATFEALAGARRLRRGPIWLRHQPGERADRARVAYAIGRRVGTAVTRNRLRRRLRAIVATAEAEGRLDPGAYLIGVTPEAPAMTYAELEQTVFRLLEDAREARP